MTINRQAFGISELSVYSDGHYTCRLADFKITKIEECPVITSPNPADNPWNHSKMHIKRSGSQPSGKGSSDLFHRECSHGSTL